MLARAERISRAIRGVHRQPTCCYIAAAVIIGGTALDRWPWQRVGTFVGTILLVEVTNGLVLLNISCFYQPVVIGRDPEIALVLDKLKQAPRGLREHERLDRHRARARGDGLTSTTDRSAPSTSIDASDPGTARSSRSSATMARASRR